MNTEHSGKPWSEIEDTKMMDLIQQGKHMDEIAIKHGRTTGSIRTRLICMSKNLYYSGKSVDEIKQIIKILTIHEIQKAIETNQISQPSPEIIKPSEDKQEEILLKLDKIEEMLNKILIHKTLNQSDVPWNPRVTESHPAEIKITERIWTEQLLQRMEKHKDNKSKLKEIRKEHDIPTKEFYAKVKTFETS